MNISPYYQHKRIPRKLKKKVKKICGIHLQKDINVNLWYYLGKTNPKHRDYLIKLMCEEYDKRRDTSSD
jgi:hypothetical protein